MELGRSVQQFDGRTDGLGARLGGFRGYLLALEGDALRIERAAQDAGVALERVLEFRSFYSRKAWLKFCRSGATWPDWREALLSRSAEGLKPRFVCYRVG